eukprot:12931978-Prorocentrum_lima.AAC.1
MGSQEPGKVPDEGGQPPQELQGQQQAEVQLQMQQLNDGKQQGQQRPRDQGYEPPQYFRPFCQSEVIRKRSKLQKAFKLTEEFLKVMRDLDDSL